MELRALQYFVAVVENGSITAAANALHISQPPLSTQIKGLEDELGIILFVRKPRNIELTDAGKVCYERAKALITFTNSIFKEMKNYGEGLRGTVRMGIPSSCSGLLLAYVAEVFHKEYPGIFFELTEDNTYDLISKLGSGTIDVALVRTPFEANLDDYNSIKVRDDHIMAVGDRKYFEGLDKKKIISIESLDGKPLLSYRRWAGSINTAFNIHHKKVNFFCLSDSAHTAVTWAEQGLGIAIVPESAMPGSPKKNNVIKQIRGDGLTTSIYGIFRKNAYISPCAKLFIDMFTEYHCQEKDDK